jgi:deoxyribonuclease-4
MRLDCVQVFTRNQRQWRTPPLRPEAVGEWNAQLRDLGWTGRRGPARTVSHASYLINLASPDRATWLRSIDLLRVELERCEALSIPRCVVHPGAHRGPAPAAGVAHDLEASPSRWERSGLARVARALDRVHRSLRGYRTVTVLETTAGGGSSLGFDFRHLAWVRAAAREPQRIGFCLDTCHVVAAGYDMSSPARARAVLQRWHSVCGLGHLMVVHLNDSRGRPGSRLDRHTHIGAGCCSASCFRSLLNHPRLRRVPMILETPKGASPGGTSWDLVNLRRLKRLARDSTDADREASRTSRTR